MPHRVVITGVGCISPFGRTAADFFKGLKEGRSGSRRLSLVNDPELECQVAAEVPDFDPSHYIDARDLKRVPRLIPMAIGASREAFFDAGLDLKNTPLEALQKIGVVVGTGGGGIEFAEKRYEEFYKHNNRRVTPYCVSSSFVGMLSSEISIALGLRGISHVISTGCTSSTDAMAYAYQLIQSGQEDLLLTGGAEACITQGIMAGFGRMKVVSMAYNDAPKKASRPFDKMRDGFVLGEGAWMFVIESFERAKKRGAKIYAEIVGYGSTCDAYHRVAAKPDAVEPARAMMLALSRAGLKENDIDCIQLHGTATLMNDEVETKAVKMAFKKHAQSLSLSALKSMIGHSQGACGAAGVMAAVFSLKEQFIPPTLNLENPDPECDLNYTPNKGVSRSVSHVLCNTIAFGSKNSALVLKKSPVS